MTRRRGEPVSVLLCRLCPKALCFFNTATLLNSPRRRATVTALAPSALPLSAALPLPALGMPARAAELVLLALAGLARASAHGAVTRPSPRRLASSPYCPWCIGEHQALANPWGIVNRSVEPSSPCMGTSRADRAYTPAEFSHYASLAGAASDTYVAGDPFEATIVLDADHNGDARWSFCPHTESETEECFGRAEHLLTEWTDVHAYWGEASTRDHGFDGRHFPQMLRLPASMPHGRVTLRWQWVCKWTDEIFISCIDVAVTAASSRTPPVPMSAPTFAPMSSPTAAPTVAPTAAPTTVPTFAPTAAPFPAPTLAPAAAPVQPPVAAPSLAPTAAPTSAPTSPLMQPPFSAPSPAPTRAPSSAPAPAPAHSCVGEWQKCGGQGWTGPDCCTAGLICTFENAWDSKCLRDGHGEQCSETWEQCGGEGWSGPTCCAPGLQCDSTSDHYSQCRPAGTAVLVRIQDHRSSFLARGSVLFQTAAIVLEGGGRCARARPGGLI
ncbi:unnamed protein product [Prorocentrum cordatum]|uniref:CBM1 domain-containing protein n=1 Tax=Prorocentrum cordatum TaxID=2364126 RepID=A0ABN9U8P0_9DINO|nr:unnamed protein product [Polarella glacialis]